MPWVSLKASKIVVVGATCGLLAAAVNVSVPDRCPAGRSSRLASHCDDLHRRRASVANSNSPASSSGSPPPSRPASTVGTEDVRTPLRHARRDGSRRSTARSFRDFAARSDAVAGRDGAPSRRRHGPARPDGRPHRPAGDRRGCPSPSWRRSISTSRGSRPKPTASARHGPAAAQGGAVAPLPGLLDRPRGGVRPRCGPPGAPRVAQPPARPRAGRPAALDRGPARRLGPARSRQCGGHGRQHAAPGPQRHPRPARPRDGTRQQALRRGADQHVPGALHGGRGRPARRLQSALRRPLRSRLRPHPGAPLRRPRGSGGRPAA